MRTPWHVLANLSALCVSNFSGGPCFIMSAAGNAEQMKNRRNYYRLLQVQPDASVEVIRSSFRAIMRGLKQHPDLGGSHWHAALLNEAYETLIDPNRRADYDQTLYTQSVKTRPSISKQNSSLIGTGHTVCQSLVGSPSDSSSESMFDENSDGPGRRAFRRMKRD